MLDFAFNTLTNIRCGEFPLHHAFVLKVYYIQGCPLKFSFLTCAPSDLVSVVDLYSVMPIVHKVEVSSIDNFEL